jgi:septal ring factor EnvC (AmiA/AmiB activator)
MTSPLPLLLCAALLLSACGRTGTTHADAEYQQRVRAQMDEYDRQARAAEEQQRKTDQQLAKADEQQRKLDEQNARFDALLDKWEEQARRQDAILEALEKQHGITK